MIAKSPDQAKAQQAAIEGPVVQGREVQLKGDLDEQMAALSPAEQSVQAQVQRLAPVQAKVGANIQRAAVSVPQGSPVKNPGALDAQYGAPKGTFADVKVATGEQSFLGGIGAQAATQGKNIALPSSDLNSHSAKHEFAHVANNAIHGAPTETMAGTNICPPNTTDEKRADALASKV